MISLPFLGTVNGGKFEADDKEAFKRAFYLHEGKRVKVQVTRYNKRRTNPQNAFYWGVIIPIIADFMGERDGEEVHDYLKTQFNFKMKELGTVTVKIPKSTTKLNTVEFEEYIEKIREWAAKELGIYIPNPNET